MTTREPSTPPRLAAIGVGTNTIRLIVAEVQDDTVASTSRRAVGDEVEFDFDSNRNDIAAGATRLSANFIVARAVGRRDRRDPLVCF